MPIKTDCRMRALLLLQVAYETKYFKKETVHVANMWLSIAMLEDMLRVCKEQTQTNARPN
jgi:hypothetical protein